MAEREMPQPPYEGLPLAQRLRDVPFDELPKAVQKRLEIMTRQAEGGDTGIDTS
jgi:hypothetical protein